MKDELKSPLNIAAVVIIFVAPLAYGTVHPLSIALFKSLILILFLGIVLRITAGRHIPLKNKRIILPAVAFLSVGLVQTIPIPTELLKRLFPSRWDMLYLDFDSLGMGGIIPRFHSLSLDPTATKAVFSLLLFYIILYYSLSQLLSSRKTVRFLSWAIMLAGFVVALLAIAQKFSETQSIYWLGLKRNTFYGPFINPNHCAIYLTSIALFTFAHLIKEGSRNIRFILGFVFTMLTVALIYSLSRGGIIIFLTCISIQSVFLFRKTREIPNLTKSIQLSILFLLSALAVLLLWWGSYRVFGEIKSIQSISLRSDFRIMLWKDTLHAFKDFFVLGTGLGTYKEVIAHYCTFYRNVQIEFAENDFLQILMETGILGFSCVIALLAGLLAKISSVVSRNITEIPRAQIGAIFAILALILNSLISFNLYIPGIASLGIFFLAFLSMSMKRYV